MARSHRKTTPIRGQITIILIMILILLVIFGALHYISSETVRRSGEQAQQTQALQQESVQPIRELVISCLDLSTTDALQLIGKQGGYIYESQGGTKPDFDQRPMALGGDLGERFATFEESKVAYAVFPPTGRAGAYHSRPPAYPFRTFPEIHRDGDVITTDFTGGYFGRNRLVPLNASINTSAQQQLNHYIAHALEECISWDQFPENLVITPGIPHVNITLGETDVTAVLSYPINVTDTVTGATTKLKEFIAKAPVRLRKLFSFMNYLTDKDVTNASFRVDQERFAGIQVQRREHVFEDDYLLRLNDDQSRILDVPYRFQFLVHNRRPALFLVNGTREEQAEAVNDFVVCASWTQNGEPIPAEVSIADGRLLIENAPACSQGDDPLPELLDIPLNALDPDEDELNYFFDVSRPDGRMIGRTYTTYAIDDRQIASHNREGNKIKLNVTVKDERRTDYQMLRFRAENRVAST